MKSSSIKEIILMIVVVILGLALLNPFHILMSSMLEMTLYGLLLAATALFAGFIAREKASDEREEKHRASAGRSGYLLGLFVLILGIAAQTFSHKHVDPWLTVALIAMVIGKLSSRMYTRKFD